MSRDLQQQLLARIDTAVTLLDLPLTRDHIELLAAELTPGVKSLLAEQDATIAELQPVAYTVAEAVDSSERVVSEYAGCTLSIHPDVAEDAPAALLGLELRSTQSDVLALDVPSATELVVTVRPRIAEAWVWWLNKFEAADCSLQQPCCATATGRYGDVAVELRGDRVPELLASHSADRLASLFAGHPW